MNMKHEVFSASGLSFDVDLAAEGLLTELNISRKPIYSAGCKPFDLCSRIWQITEYPNAFSVLSRMAKMLGYT